MKKVFIFCFCLVFLSSSSLVQVNLYSQQTFSKDTLFLAALEIMRETTYCALVTVDSTGQPQVRTMNPFPANDDLVTWFGTTRYSRKVREIRNNPKVAVYYADHLNAKGYVNISGIAEIIDNRDLLMKMKRAYWENIPDWKEDFVLIRIVPVAVEVINYKHRLTNAPKTFKAPWIKLE